MSRTIRILGASLRHLVLASTSLVLLVPFLWMIATSFKPPHEIFNSSLALFPTDWYAVENYTKALTASALPRFLFNGVVVCAAILLLQIFFCAPAAYVLAKLRFSGREFFFSLVLVALMIPSQVLALPLFLLCYSLGLLNTYSALVLPFCVSPFGIFLFRQFFKTIPDDVIHAARLDGLSEFGIVWRIMVPMALPAIIAFGVFSVIGHWNDLFWPLIVVNSEALMPPPLGIVAFKNEDMGTDFGPLMATATLVVAPLVIAFLAAQRWFIDGLTQGAVK